jgi:hypothetical protein
VDSYGSDRNKFCVKAENSEIRQKTVIKKAKTAHSTFADKNSQTSPCIWTIFHHLGSFLSFFFLKKSSDGIKSTYKTKKRKEKFLDVKLLTTNRTTVPTGLVHGLQIDLDESIDHVELKNSSYESSII